MTTQIVVASIGRVIPAVTRAYNALPLASRASYLAWLSASIGRAVASLDDIIAYLKANPVKSTIIIEGLVRYGAEVGEFLGLFGDNDAGRDFASSLRAVWKTVTDAEDAGNSGMTADDEQALIRDTLRVDMIKTCVRTFGSISAARRAQIAFDTLTEADWQWAIHMSERGHLSGITR